jgi:hypothetical protein
MMPEEVYKDVGNEPWGQFARRFKVVKIRDQVHARELAIKNINGSLCAHLEGCLAVNGVVVEKHSEPEPKKAKVS